LYSFRLEFAETETQLTIGDKDSLKATKNVIATYIDSVREIKFPTNKVLTAKDSTSLDSLMSVKKDLTGFIDDIIDDSTTLKFIYAKKDSLKKLLVKVRKLSLDFDKKEGAYSKDRFVALIESTIASAVTIIDTKTLPMYVFEEEPFKSIVVDLLKKREKTFLPECIKSGLDTIYRQRANAIFFSVKSRLDFNDDEPVTAYLKLKKNYTDCKLTTNRQIHLRKNKEGKDKTAPYKFFIEKVAVEFEDGTIKNIFADLRITDRKGDPTGPALRFRNLSPISISTKTDPDLFGRIKIFNSVPKDVKEEYGLSIVDSVTKKVSVKRKERIKKRIEKRKDYLYFLLGDVIDYSIIAENDKEDYSPANSVVELTKDNPRQELKKEKRSKILTVRAYTDFIGLQNDEPNGLIQIEAGKKIHINTARYGGAYIYYGFFSYIEPLLTFSKIEKNNNSMVLGFGNIDSTKLATGQKGLLVDALNLHLYQKSSFDLNLNIWKVNFPELKSNIQINTNLGVLKTNIVDTILVTGVNTAIKGSEATISVLNTIRWGFTAIWEIKPESRYGASFGWDWRRVNPLNESFSIASEDLARVNTAWVDAFLKTNDNSKLFFRYRFIFNDKVPRKNFTQIQLGYLMDIFKAKN
jgi:hypothetical protein